MKLLKQIPNLLTLTRVFLCPVIAHTLAQNNWSLSITLFVLASLTDFLDGYLARKFQWISPLGALLDPAADKIFCLSLFSLLMSKNLCPSWYLGLLFSVYLLQSMGLIVLNLPTNSIRVRFIPLLIGKWNSFLQMIWIALGLTQLINSFGTIESSIYWGGFILLGVIQITTFINYFFHFRVHLTPEFRLTN